jgi:hypothetical protein
LRILRGILLASIYSVPLELIIGRSVAFCVHPHAAWRRLSSTGRTLLVAAYCGASYTIVLALLLAL